MVLQQQRSGGRFGPIHPAHDVVQHPGQPRLHPQQIGDQVERRRARTANDDEKRTLWPHLVDFYPQFASYQSWTDRDIPVVILEPG